MAGYLAYILPVDGSGGRPDQGLPGGRPGRPDQGLPPQWGGPTDPDYGQGGGHPSQPIYHPGHPDHGRPVDPGYGQGGGRPDQGLPPQWGGGHPDQGLPGGGHPSQPIELPPGGTPVPPEEIQLPEPPPAHTADLVIAMKKPGEPWEVMAYETGNKPDQGTPNPTPKGRRDR